MKELRLLLSLLLMFVIASQGALLVAQDAGADNENKGSTKVRPDNAWMKDQGADTVGKTLAVSEWELEQLLKPLPKDQLKDEAERWRGALQAAMTRLAEIEIALDAGPEAEAKATLDTEMKNASSRPRRFVVRSLLHRGRGLQGQGRRRRGSRGLPRGGSRLEAWVVICPRI